MRHSRHPCCAPGTESSRRMFSPCLYLVFNDPVEELVVDRYGADVHGARRPRFW